MVVVLADLHLDRPNILEKLRVRKEVTVTHTCLRFVCRSAMGSGLTDRSMGTDRSPPSNTKRHTTCNNT